MSPVSNILTSDPCVNSSRSFPTTDFLLKNFVESGFELADTPPGGSLNDTLESQSLASSSATNGTNGSSVPSVLCKWFGCCKEIVCGSSAQSVDNGVYIPHQSDASSPEEECDLLLLDHLITQHVQTQSSKRRKYFTCHWTDCKVYRKPSLSYKWLENHILSHLENAKARRPFQCLFDCPKRFASRPQLERHINASHLQANSPPLKVCKYPSKEFTSTKSVNNISKNASLSKIAKKKRIRKIRGFRVRSVDYYDPRTQAQITNRLILNSVQYEPVSLSSNSSPNSIMNISPRNMKSSNITLSPVKKGLLLDGPSFSTRSMSRQSSLETLPCMLDDLNLSTDNKWTFLSPSIKRLLSMPYAIIGKRSSPKHTNELLIKWYHENMSLPNEWIPESDFDVASELGSPRSKRQMCKAPSGFRIHTKNDSQRMQQTLKYSSSHLNFTV